MNKCDESYFQGQTFQRQIWHTDILVSVGKIPQVMHVIVATVSCRLIEIECIHSVGHTWTEVLNIAYLTFSISAQEVRMICLVFQVYYLGEGEESKQWLQQQDNTPEKLCLSHIKAVATCLASSYPRVTPIVWDDMLRGMSEETLAGVCPAMG